MVILGKFRGNHRTFCGYYRRFLWYSNLYLKQFVPQISNSITIQKVIFLSGFSFNFSYCFDFFIPMWSTVFFRYVFPPHHLSTFFQFRILSSLCCFNWHIKFCLNFIFRFPCLCWNKTICWVNIFSIICLLIFLSWNFTILRMKHQELKIVVADTCPHTGHVAWKLSLKIVGRKLEIPRDWMFSSRLRQWRLVSWSSGKCAPWRHHHVGEITRRALDFTVVSYKS